MGTARYGQGSKGPAAGARGVTDAFLCTILGAGGASACQSQAPPPHSAAAGWQAMGCSAGAGCTSGMQAAASAGCAAGMGAEGGAGSGSSTSRGSSESGSRPLCTACKTCTVSAHMQGGGVHGSSAVSAVAAHQESRTGTAGEGLPLTTHSKLNSHSPPHSTKPARTQQVQVVCEREVEEARRHQPIPQQQSAVRRPRRLCFSGVHPQAGVAVHRSRQLGGGEWLG